MLDIITCFLGWLLIACQAWSVKYHFNIQTMPAEAKIISALVILFAVLLTYLSFTNVQPASVQYIGLLLLLGSLALFWRTIMESRKAKLLAAFDESLPHGLLTTGPYRYVRHPFYSSYMLHWTGWSIAAWHPLAVVPVAAMVTTYWFAARDEEAKFSRTELSDAYLDYKNRTGQFFFKLF